MEYDDIKRDIKLLSEKKFQMITNARTQGRELTKEEDAIISEMDGAIIAMTNSLPDKPLTVGFSGQSYGGGTSRTSAAGGRDYKAMFNLTHTDKGGFNNGADFLRAIDSGRYDPRLDVLNTAVEGIGSSGGFSVPTEFSRQWLDDSLPNEVVRKLCRVYPMNSETKEIPGWDAADMTDGATHGGLTMQFLAESAGATAQTPKMRKISLSAKMAAIYVNASLELVQDGADFVTNLETALRKSIGYGIDRYCISGSGAGCPQGILNAACKVQVPKALGQSADSIVYANLKAMFARQLNPQNAVWLFNNTAIPELLEQSVSVGVGGDFVPLLSEKDGQFRIFGRPVYFHPAMPTLGDADDCAFVDFNYYALGLRQEVMIEQTDAVRWDYRERSYRILMRFDGMCTLNAAVQPEHGDTLSPIVTLAERAA